MTLVGPRYFGFVTGGSLDAATCADVLTTGWDQLAFNPTSSPAAAAVEEVVGDWLKQALGLPAGASFGLVTGGQGANTVALAAARHRVLARAGWDVEATRPRGRAGDPSGCGRGASRDGGSQPSTARTRRGRRRTGRRRRERRGRPRRARASPRRRRPDSPTIVCLQAGNVNTGACDDLAAACAAARQRDAWVHVDGAFGLWAAASQSKRHLVNGIELADSWAVDGHKWLNVPYDTGFVLCADAEAHRASMSYTAAYLEGQGSDALRAPSDYVPESSRRARGFASWAALCELGQRASPSSSIAAARWRAASASSSARSTGSRSGTRSCSTRCW